MQRTVIRNNVNACLYSKLSRIFVGPKIVNKACAASNKKPYGK